LFITGVNDTGNKLFSGVNDTGENLLPVSLAPAIILCHGFSVIAGVVDTGEQFITGDSDTGNNFVAGDNDTGDQLSPVINLLPVTRTRTPWRWGAAKDRRKLKGINQRYLRPPKSATAAEVGHGRRWCHWNRREKLHPKTPHTS
jgi:hypothetical protein